MSKKDFLFSGVLDFTKYKKKTVFNWIGGDEEKKSKSVTIGGAKKPKVRNLMGALLIPILLVLGCSEQFSKLS